MGLLLSSILHGQELKPCQKIDFSAVAEYAIPNLDRTTSGGISANDIKQESAFLKKCIKKYSVCIIENPPNNSKWVNKRLIAPAFDENFNSGDTDLVFGMLQYVDKKTGASVCIVAINEQSHVLPWYGSSWVINGDSIKEYEISSEHFTPRMTPQTLYRALLKTHEEAVINNKYRKPFDTQP